MKFIQKIEIIQIIKEYDKQINRLIKETYKSTLQNIFQHYFE